MSRAVDTCVTRSPTATDMGCKNANRVVEFTTLFELFLTGVYAALEDEQCSVGKLMELASSLSRCRNLKVYLCAGAHCLNLTEIVQLVRVPRERVGYWV